MKYTLVDGHVVDVIIGNMNNQSRAKEAFSALSGLSDLTVEKIIRTIDQSYAGTLHSYQLTSTTADVSVARTIHVPYWTVVDIKTSARLARIETPREAARVIEAQLFAGATQK